MRQAMVLGLVITITSGLASPAAFAQPVTAPTTPSAEVPSAPATIAPEPSIIMPGQELDPRSLANRAINRELRGDRPGAIADLSAAIAKESDPAHRASMEHLLQLLQSQP